MVTIKQLKQELHSPHTPKRQRELIRTAILYLETKPKKKYIKNQVDVLQKRIDSVANKFTYWNRHVCPVEVKPHNRRRMYNKETGITHMNKQLNFLKFILQ